MSKATQHVSDPHHLTQLLSKQSFPLDLSLVEKKLDTYRDFLFARDQSPAFTNRNGDTVQGANKPSKQAPGLESWLPEGGPAGSFAPVPTLFRLLLIMFSACVGSALCSSRLLFSPLTRGSWLGEPRAPECRDNQSPGTTAGRRQLR